MKKIFSLTLWNVLSVILSTLFAIVLIAYIVCNAYATTINQTLGIETSKIHYGDEEVEDYHKAVYVGNEKIKSVAEQVCEEVEAEGLVLLKNNENTLPFNKKSKVSLFGTGSVYINCSGQGMRTASDKDNYPTFKQALESVDVEVNEKLWDFYSKGAGSSYGGYKRLDSATNLQTYYINEAPWSAYDTALRNSFAEYGDAAIVVITRDSTEGSDVNTTGSDGANGNYLALSPEEEDLLKQITELKNNGTFKKVIVVINTTLQLQMDFLRNEEISVDACMWVGNTGMSGINAVAKAMVGDVVPSGRLTDTLAYDNFSSPAMMSWMLNENGTFSQKYGDSRLDSTQQYYGVYVEGIYVGYRYYETRYADVIEGTQNVGEYDYSDDVAYTFGYGMSYTTFDYSDFKVSESEDGKSYDVSVTVTNTGDSYTGKEVVQIYLQKPYTDYAKKHMMEVSAIELVGFAKTQPLAPGAEQTVSICVEKELFASYDVYGAGTYVLDEGDYYLTVGTDAHDAVNNILALKGYEVNGDAQLAEKVCTVDEIDTKIYSVSSETGETITNRLGDIDLNRYANAGGNTVTYVSRSNWEGTLPVKPVSIALTEAMYNDLQCDKPVKSEGETPVYGKNNGITLVQLRGKPYDDSMWNDLLDQLTFEEQNILLTTQYVSSPAIESIVKPKTQEQDGPTYCKECQELTGARFPSENIWAATFNTELVAKVGEVMASDSLNGGYQGLYVPGINIHRTPYGGRNHEYFSEDPLLTGIMGMVEIQSIQAQGVIAYPKHYAFNDQETNRNGIGVWLNEQSAREIYLRPWQYAAGITKGNSHAVMSAFNRVGTAWASANKGLITDILRGEFGFDGFVLTDMADANGASYMSTIDGVVAGTDAWLSSGKDHTFVPYKNNNTVLNAMRESTHRILYVMCNFSASMNGISESTWIEIIPAWWDTTLTVALISVSILTAGAIAMMIISTIKKERTKN